MSLPDRDAVEALLKTPGLDERTRPLASAASTLFSYCVQLGDALRQAKEERDALRGELEAVKRRLGM